MAEQFDMDIYNAALEKGYYEPPKDNFARNKNSNLVLSGDSGSQNKNLNLTHLAENYKPYNNIEYKQFCEDGEK